MDEIQINPVPSAKSAIDWRRTPYRSEVCLFAAGIGVFVLLRFRDYDNIWIANRCGSLAQLAEQRPFKPRVLGSSPRGLIFTLEDRYSLQKGMPVFLFWDSVSPYLMQLIYFSLGGSLRESRWDSDDASISANQLLFMVAPVVSSNQCFQVARLDLLSGKYLFDRR